jgi:hypothetical protein
MVPSERTVTSASGTARRPPATSTRGCAVRPGPSGPKHPVATFDMLNLWFFGDAARRQQPELAPEERGAELRRGDRGLSVEQATYEARRCLSMRQLHRVRRLPGACPEDAVIKLGVGHGYVFDLRPLHRLRACYQQCPVHSIEMFPEPG